MSRKTGAAEVRQKPNAALVERRMVISKTHAISNVNMTCNAYELLPLQSTKMPLAPTLQDLCPLSAHCSWSHHFEE